MDRAGTLDGLLQQMYMERNQRVFKSETSFIHAVCREGLKPVKKLAKSLGKVVIKKKSLHDKYIR